MTLLDWIAAPLLLFLLPIPVFWLMLHPFAKQWRARGKKAAYATAIPIAWGSGIALLYFLRGPLLADGEPAAWVAGAGLVCIATAIAIFIRVEREMGADRLLGKVELSGGGELRIAGLYSRIRHPSYAAQMLAMVGACLLAGTRAIWAAAAVWLLLQLMMIRFEERELVARFGASYEEYRRKVPAFFPRMSR